MRSPYTTLTRVLRLDGGLARLARLGEKMCEVSRLRGLPRGVLPAEGGGAGRGAPLLQVLLQLRDRVPRQVQPERELADLVAEDARHAAQLARVVLSQPALEQQQVGGRVALVGGVQVPLHLGQEPDLEAVSDQQLEVGRLVELLAVGLDCLDVAVVVVTGQLLQRLLELQHEGELLRPGGQTEHCPGRDGALRADRGQRVLGVFF